MDDKRVLSALSMSRCVIALIVVSFISVLAACREEPQFDKSLPPEDWYKDAYSAIDNKNFSKLRKLIGKNDINKLGYHKFYDNPLFYAARFSDIECLRFFFELGADKDLVLMDKTPLCVATSSIEGEPAMRYLLDMGCELHPRGVKKAPIIQASQDGCVRYIKLLLEYGDDVNYSNANEDGTTPLMAACDHDARDFEKHKEAIEYLLSCGADVNARNNNGNTALHLIFINSRHNFGTSSELLALLLKAGADVNIRNNKGQTPLMLASVDQPIHILDVLIRAGAHVHGEDDDGRKAKDYASKTENWQAVEFLEQAN